MPISGSTTVSFGLRPARSSIRSSDAANSPYSVPISSTSSFGRIQHRDRRQLAADVHRAARDPADSDRLEGDEDPERAGDVALGRRRVAGQGGDLVDSASLMLAGDGIRAIPRPPSLSSTSNARCRRWVSAS